MSHSVKKADNAIPRPRLQQLIAAAIRAPSGDNCQPWAFRSGSDGQLSIDILPQRAKSFFDFKHRATFFSVGAVLENLRIEAAFQDQGLRVDYRDGECPGEAAALVSLSDKPESPVDAGLHQAMFDRTVNRRPFRHRAPSADQLSALTADPIEHSATRIFTERSDIGTWARLIYLADRIRFSHPQIHAEVFGKILLSRKQINDERMGLEYDRLGIGPGAPMVLKTLKPWKRMQQLSRFGAAAALSKQSRMVAGSTGAMVLVTLPDNSPENWMRGGEQVERLWVRAQHLGLCSHPMTVALYLSQRYREEGMTNFLPEHEPLLKEISTGLEPMLDGRVGAMVFRLGNGWRMSGPAIRLPIEDFLPRD